MKPFTGKGFNRLQFVRYPDLTYFISFTADRQYWWIFCYFIIIDCWKKL